MATTVTDSRVGGAPKSASASCFAFDELEFRGDYNRHPFLIKHNLTEHPLMQFDSLIELVKRLPPERVPFYSAHIPVTASFDTAARDFRTNRTLEDTLAHMDVAGSYILINQPEIDPIYGKFLNDMIAEIQEYAHDPGVREPHAYIFISSPGSTTPYHQDREINFLLQVRGRKTVYLWDPADRSVLSETEREKLFAEEGKPRPPYKDEYQLKALAFELSPGLGVHHPFIAPHWVKNGGEVSVSFAVTYRTRETHRIANAYRMNYWLRRAGLTPTPVGQARARDSIKAAAYPAVKAGIRTAAQVRNRVLGRKTEQAPAANH